MSGKSIIWKAFVFVAAISLLSGCDGTSSSVGNLTGPQKNAFRSAQQYLAISGFSRDGLIQQLVYGSNYNVADATVAVDSLNIDWNNQAIRSAQQYLAIFGFSCGELINQLSAGDHYTESQASYGARQTSACR